MKNLTETILKNGIDNMYFITEVKPLRTALFISYTSSSDPDIEMLCSIDEERYQVKDNYKITLKPIYDGFAKEHYYISDLEQMINSGSIKMLVNFKL